MPYFLKPEVMFSEVEWSELQNKLDNSQLTKAEAIPALVRAAQVAFFVTQNYGGTELRKIKLRYSCTWAMPLEYDPIMDLWVRLLDRFLINTDGQLDREVLKALQLVDRLPFTVVPGEQDNFGWVTAVVIIRNVSWII
jgi:hypothetical protein